MFRFTIRELLLLTAIVAMGVAWWVDRYYVGNSGRLRSMAMEIALFEFGWTVEQHDPEVRFRNQKTGEIDYIFTEGRGPGQR